MRVDTSGWKIGTFVGYVHVTKPEPVDTEGRQLRWHIVVTQPGRERRVSECIEAELGLRCYWPRLHRKTPGGRRRSREIEISMFPSRVLVLMPGTNEAYWRIRWTIGVVDFMHLADSHKLASLPEDEIDRIRKVEAKKDAKYRNFLLKAEQSPFAPGRNVWAEVLPGRKMFGQIVDRDGQGRVNVRLVEKIFGRDVWPVKPHLLQFVDDTMPPPTIEKIPAKVGPSPIPALV